MNLKSFCVKGSTLDFASFYIKLVSRPKFMSGSVRAILLDRRGTCIHSEIDTLLLNFSFEHPSGATTGDAVAMTGSSREVSGSNPVGKLNVEFSVATFVL